MLTLKDIIEIENTPEILGFTCSGTDYLLWPRIRITVIRMVLDKEIYGEETLVKDDPKLPLGKVLKCFADGYIHNLKFLNRQAKIIFFNSGITNIKVDSAYFNRVSDYFALSFPDSTLLIEDAFQWQHFKPRANKNVMYHAPYTLSTAFLAKLPIRTFNEQAVLRFIKFIEARLQKVIGFQLTEKQKALLHGTLVRYCRSLRTQLDLYERLYRRLNPGLIIFENGCYGYRGHIIRLAKDMGIKTAEMQHGMISAGHDAYNYAPLIAQSSNYREYLPDYFLAYGQWWAERINAPMEMIIIGNPYYQEMKQKYATGCSSKNVILLLSDGLRFQAYFEMAKSLKESVKNEYEIMVRPHPIERKFALEQFAQNDAGIIIDNSENLYERLARTYAVIGEISTALFEAVGLVHKIFVMNNEITTFGLPECPFEQFDSIEELKTRLFSDNSGNVNETIEASIWADGWENNYREFITQCIGLKV